MFQYKVQHHATHNHSTRTAVPIRRNVSCSLKTTQHHNRSSSCSRSSPTMRDDASTPIPIARTAMNFSNQKAQNASHTEWMHTNNSTIPQWTFETTSRQVPVPSPVGSSQFLTAIPLPFSTLTLWSPDRCRCLLRALAPKPVEVRVAGGPRSDRHAVRVSTCAVHSPYARPAVCRSRHLAV